MLDGWRRVTPIRASLKNKKPSREDWAFCLKLDGAGKRNRTPDLRITNALLYRLSYSGIRRNEIIGTSLTLWQAPGSIFCFEMVAGDAIHLVLRAEEYRHAL